MPNDNFYRLLDINERSVLPEELDFIRSCLSDEDELVRMEAIPLLVDNPYGTDADIDRIVEMCDDEACLVRTEAYEALSKIISTKATDRLYKAVVSEKDEAARSWAVEMWADSVVKHKPSDENYKEQKEFILKQMYSENNRDSDVCRLSCYYALYLFGDPCALESILSYLDNSDYHIRCSVVNLLKDVVKENDIPDAVRSFEKRLKTEDTEAVTTSIDKAIKELKT